MIVRALALLLILGPAAGAQQYEFAVAGEVFTCGITTPLVRSEASFHFPEPPRPTMQRQGPVPVEEITSIAQGPGGALFGVRSMSSAVVRLAQDGSTIPFFDGVPNLFASGGIAVAASGRVFMTLQPGGDSSLLGVISPSGVLEALHPLPVWVNNSILAVANDGCTVYYVQHHSWMAPSIKRINGCTGALLPDLAPLANVSDIEVLPDGQLLVTVEKEKEVRLYSSVGTRLRTLFTPQAYGYFPNAAPEQATLVDGVLWVAVAKENCQTEIVRVSLDTGAEAGSRRHVDLVIANSLVVAPSPVAAGAQPFEAVVLGASQGSCIGLEPGYHRQGLEWIGPDRNETDTTLRAMAADGGGRVFVITGSNPYRIFLVRPDGTRTLFAEGSGGSSSIAATEAGRVFVAAARNGEYRIDRFSRFGTLEASYPRPAVRHNHVGFDVAADGCTLFWASNTGPRDALGSTIHRIDGCTGGVLPDFANVPFLTDFEVLPDGQVLVATSHSVLLYDASGTFVRAVVPGFEIYGFRRNVHSLDQIAVRDGVLWMMANDVCGQGNLLRVALEDGTELSRRPLGLINVGYDLAVSPRPRRRRAAGH